MLLPTFVAIVCEAQLGFCLYVAVVLFYGWDLLPLSASFSASISQQLFCWMFEYSPQRWQPYLLLIQVLFDYFLLERMARSKVWRKWPPFHCWKFDKVRENIEDTLSVSERSELSAHQFCATDWWRKIERLLYFLLVYWFFFWKNKSILSIFSVATIIENFWVQPPLSLSYPPLDFPATLPWMPFVYIK